MAQALIVAGTGILQEVRTSPSWEFSDIVRATQVYRSASYDLAVASAPRKGALGAGTFAGMKVVSSKVEKEKGQVAQLTIVLEGPGPIDDATVPPDETELVYGREDFDIRKLPKYAALTSEDLWGIEAYINSADFQTVDFFDWLTEGPNGDLIQNLLSKLQRGETSKYIFPPVYTFTSYSLDEPIPSGGGFIEVPFGSVTPPSNYQFLRCGDTVSYNQTYYKLTRTWIGAESFDTDIYDA